MKSITQIINENDDDRRFVIINIDNDTCKFINTNEAKSIINRKDVKLKHNNLNSPLNIMYALKEGGTIIFSDGSNDKIIVRVK